MCMDNSTPFTSPDDTHSTLPKKFYIQVIQLKPLKGINVRNVRNVPCQRINAYTSQKMIWC